MSIVEPPTEGLGTPPELDRSAETACPTCGPMTTEAHPNQTGIVRCANCKEWLHPCGHVLRVAGCGGCDPSAIEFIIESLMSRAEQETAEANAEPDPLTGRHSTLAPFLLVRDIRAAISTSPAFGTEVEVLWNIYLNACDIDASCDCAAGLLAETRLRNLLGAGWHDVCRAAVITTAPVNTTPRPAGRP